MIGIQIIAVGFALVALFFCYVHYRKGDLSLNEFLVWLLIWAGFLGITLMPDLVSPYVQKIGFARLMDFVVMLAFVVLFSVLIHNYFVVNVLRRRIENLVRKIALKDMDDQN